MRMHRVAFMVGLIAATFGMAACKGSQAPAPSESETSTQAMNGPEAKPGVTAGAARLVLPVVAGRPGVVYFRVSNGTSGKLTLASVYVDGVDKTEMHRTSGGAMLPVKTVDIGPGASIVFAPGGLHVMAFDISPSLKAGGQTELTLTFADGDKVSVPVKIEAMGAHGDGMAGMSH